MSQTIIWNLDGDWEKFKVGDKIPDGKSGEWRVSHFEIPENDYLRMRYIIQGRDCGSGRFVCLSYKGIHPETGQQTYLPMMSDTRAEILDHYEVIDAMAWPHTERVLIHGLGLGMVLNAALSFDHVKHVDVVEKDPDVIKLIAPSYTSDPRVHIHEGDAFTYKFPPNTRWDIAWHDIWGTISAENLPDMFTLKRRYQNRSDWQGCWAERECRKLRDEQKFLDTATEEDIADREWKRFEQAHGKKATKEIRQFLAEQLAQLATTASSTAQGGAHD